MTTEQSSAETVRGAAPWRFRTDVEGLRAIAIAAVVGYHVGLPFFAGGFVGVDVFFVISGFLITGLLVAEAHLDRARVARPLLGAAGQAPAPRRRPWCSSSSPSPRGSRSRRSTTGRPGSTSRRRPLRREHALRVPGHRLPRENAAPSPVLHFWSLGVEEQFYARVAAADHRDRCVRHVAPPQGDAGGPRSVSRGPLALVLAALGVVSFLVSLRLTDRIEPWAFFSMPTRAWEFAIGGLRGDRLGRAATPAAGRARRRWMARGARAARLDRAAEQRASPTPGPPRSGRCSARPR